MFIQLSAFQAIYFSPVFRLFIRSLKGATAIEYGLIAGGISIVIMVAVFAVGFDIKSMFTFMQFNMSSAATHIK